MKPTLALNLIILITLGLVMGDDLQSVDIIECKPETCAATSCIPAPKTCPAGYKVGHGGLCGCCRGCLKVLHLAEACQEVSGPFWPTERCDLGLWCSEGRCIKEWTK